MHDASDVWRPDDRRWAEEASTGLGVYVHVPFCSHRCGYCDFAAFEGLDGLMEPYVERLVRELDERVTEPATSVFVGGGTPSRLPAPLLQRLLDSIPKDLDAECTVEMNPESTSPEVLEAARTGGANRVSMGMQSSAPHVLTFLERRHQPERVPEAVAAARAAGFESINVDLIYGTPGESAADWSESLDAALNLGVDHLSCYALTVEAATPLGRSVAAGSKPAPDEDVLGARLEATADRLAREGFVRYEISNWARVGSPPSRHNLRYWSGGAYVGAGCGAHSYDPLSRVRSWNHRHPRTYVEADDPVAGSEQLDASDLAFERLMLGLRRASGVRLDAHEASAVPSDLLVDGLCTIADQHIRLTKRGMAVADSVVQRLSLALGEC